MESQKDKLLRLWKARQEAEGHDVSGVTTLKEAEHFFDKKEDAKPAELPEAPEVPEVEEEPEQPKKQQKKAKAPKKSKEV